MELLIYFALIGLTMGIFVTSVYQVIDHSAKLNKQNFIEEEASFILRKIQWSLTGAQAIVLPIAGTSGSMLTVNKYSYGGNPVTIDLSGGSVRISKGLAAPVALNSANVTVNSLSFTHIAPVGLVPGAVQTTLNLNGQNYSMTMYKKNP